tara:strand:+ start:974 stop:1138 length:165 start_codon:yes stop_codon:yes gene_type:complete
MLRSRIVVPYKITATSAIYFCIIIRNDPVKKAVLKLNNTDSLPIIRLRIVRIKL